MRELVAAIMKARGWKQTELAERLGTTQSIVSRWLSGSEPRGHKRDVLRALARESGIYDDGPAYIPIMGFVGAGGDVSPDFEQIPDDGLEQVELDAPVGIVKDPIGFVVRGQSMISRYDEGDIVVVERDQPYPPEEMYGMTAVVRTHDGHRYLKVVQRGYERGTFNLESLRKEDDDEPIRSVRVAWASPVRVIIPNVGRRLRERHRTEP
jgi:transcriptional regulator with XRE-family HTH domain